jgi:hypothetical protein
MQAYMVRYIGDFSGYDSISLSFYYWAVTGSFSLADYLSFYTSPDGATFTERWAQTGISSGGWQVVTPTIPLDTQYIMFRFISDPTVGLGPYEGAYVDDIIITASDSVRPSSSASPLPAYSSVSPVSVAYLASDSGSGIGFVELYYRLGTSGSFSKYITAGNPSGHWMTSPIAFDTSLTGGDGLYQLYTVATDGFGNMELPPGTPDTAITVDKIAPSTLHSISGTAGTNSWYTSSVTVTLVAGDSASGVASIHYQLGSGGWQTYGSSFVYSTEGDHLLEYYSTDNAGNDESIKNTPIRIDTSNPISNIVVTGSAGTNDWLIGTSVTVNLTATDSISGGSSIYYAIDGGSIQSYANEFQVSKDGVTTIGYYATDSAGNSESHKLYSFKLDTTDPVTQAALSGTRGDNLWYVSSVSLTLSPLDAVSGVNWTKYSLDNGSWQPYSGSFSITTDGAHTVEFYSQDNSSRTEVTRNTTFKIDTVVPSLTIDVLNNTKSTSNSIMVSWSSSDGTSGVNRTEYSLDGGAFQVCTGSSLDLKGLADGDHNLVLKVTDNAGNSIAKSVSFKVNTNVFSMSGPVGPWLDIGLILVALFIVVLLVLLLRRRRGETEPSKPENTKTT